MFLLFAEASKEEVEDCLAEMCSGDRNCWLYPPESPALYIHHWEDFEEELGDEGMELVIHGLGGRPTVALMADVSGRVSGDEEVRRLISILLGRFRGVVQDDHTEHCWTVEEIESGHRVQAHPFFDYKGWYAEGRSDSGRSLAEGVVHAAINERTDGLEMIVTQVRERAFGWVVYYTSRLWWETREFRYAIVGNAPFYVTRKDHRLIQLGTVGIPELIAEVERGLAEEGEE